MAKSNRNLTDIFQDTANAIRGKTGLSEPINPRDFADEIDSIPTGGGGDETKMLIEGDLSEISNSEVTKIRDYAFFAIAALTKASFPKCLKVGRSAFNLCRNLSSIFLPFCSEIGEYAFANCPSLTEANYYYVLSISASTFQNCSFLTSVSFPNCLSISQSAFAGCYMLPSVAFSQCVTVGDYAFQFCSALSSVSFPNCQKISSFAFANCYSLSSVSFPDCLSVGARAFYYCSSLSSISFPNCFSIDQYAFFSCISLTEANFFHCSYLGDYAFQNCSSLTEAIFPVAVGAGNSIFANCLLLSKVDFQNCQFIATSAFYNCHKLSFIDIFNCTNINNGAFMNCFSLPSITIMNMSANATQLGNSNVFQGTPMADSSYLGYFGSIFVHPDRVSVYKSATNWVYYSDRIVAASPELVNKGIWPYEYFGRSDLTEVPSEKIDAETIGQSAFYSCTQLSEINLSRVTVIPHSAFYSLYRLKKVSFENCDFIGSYAFYSCSSLTEASFLKCKHIGFYALAFCSALSLISFPECVYIEPLAFDGCLSLTEANFPNCLSVGNNAFEYCRSLALANFPNCTFVGGNAFSTCVSLSSINFNKCLIMGDGAFRACRFLTSISFPNCLSIGNFAFTGCSKLSQAYFLTSVVPTMSSINAFQDTPMLVTAYLGYFGSVYVRASLLSQYQTASNWSRLSERFVGVNNIYSTSASITNGSCDFDYEEVAENTTIEAHIVPDDGYSYPGSVTVTGATSSYDSTTGTITISNPTDTIVVTAECGGDVPPTPSVDPVLGNNSWDVIKAVCEAGEAANYWAVGDTKTDVGTDGNTRTFQIVDMQGLYGKHVVFLQVETEPSGYVWQFQNINEYSNSAVRTAYLPAIMAKYSSELQTNLTDTTYKVAKGSNSGTILDLTDKLFLPAEKELYGFTIYGFTEEAAVLSKYQYYVTNAVASYKQKTQIGQSLPTAWWQRSPCSDFANRVCRVASDGTGNYATANNSFGVAPVFSF